MRMLLIWQSHFENHCLRAIFDFHIQSIRTIFLDTKNTESDHKQSKEPSCHACVPAIVSLSPFCPCSPGKFCQHSGQNDLMRDPIIPQAYHILLSLLTQLQSPLILLESRSCIFSDTLGTLLLQDACIIHPFCLEFSLPRF